MKSHKPLFRSLLLLSLIFLLSACGSNTQSAAGQPWNDSPIPSSTETPAPSPTPQPTPLPTPTPFPEYDITLMMVGDNLMHMGIVRSGQLEDGSYDYSMLFEDIYPQLQSADIKIINQETILGGNDLGFSGFPYFNSPTEVGDAIAAAGFNIVLHASNHAADQKLQGLQNCVSFWQEQHPDVMMLGICSETASPDITASATETASFADSSSTLPRGSAYAGNGQAYDWQVDESGIGYMTVKGITFAILNYTYGPNMEVIPSSIMGRLNILCDYDRQSGRLDFTRLNPQVPEDIAAAKENADIVIVCPHWGTEYVTSPSGYQQEFALQMTEAGADVIIGTHPHVVQPVEWIQAENGNRALCFYSLGNYVSTQKDGICMLEAMAWITFHVTENEVYIEQQQTGAIPLVCQYTSGPVRFEGVYLLQDYTEEQAAQHGIRSYGGVNLHLSDLQKWSDEIFGDNALYWDD